MVLGIDRSHRLDERRNRFQGFMVPSSFLLFMLAASCILPKPANAQSLFVPRSYALPLLPEYDGPGFANAASQGGGSSGLLKGVLIGAAVGGAAGLVLFEVAESQGLCDADEPNCEMNPSRLETVAVGAALGGVIGAVIGSRMSSNNWIPLPLVVPSLDGSVSIGFRTTVP
jgi:hypothetical protein